MCSVCKCSWWWDVHICIYWVSSVVFVDFLIKSSFKKKKTMCIKYGEPVKDSEKITLDQVQLKYYEAVRHLGNFLTLTTIVQAISIINVLVS